MDLENNYIPPVKLKKPTNEDNQNDVYCFECHHEGEVMNCDSCPRAYHSKCLGVTASVERDWTCPECEGCFSLFNIINQSTPVQRYSINELHIMLKYALHRLKSHPQAEPFLQSIDFKQSPEYFDYIIHPMNFEIIEKNLNLKKYTSTDALISDMKWILHNSFIYNGNQSKITHNARTLLKIARHEMSEIEICPECYSRSAQPVTSNWFTKPCAIPHTLCWAKMKTYQPWPAKVLRIVNDEVDVRFFGQHDRAWVSHKNCFVLSKEYPGNEKKKSPVNFEKSLSELQIHIDQLKKLYGHFTYAPPQTLINKTKPFKFVSIIDDSILPSYMTAGNSSFTFHSKQHRSLNKRPNEDFHEQSVKRARIPTNYIDDDELQSSLNVFDIFNQSDQIIFADDDLSSNPPKFRSISPTDNKLRVQALLRKYIQCKSPIIDPDVRLSMNALLDTVDALKTISEVRTNVSDQVPEQPKRTKKPRKSNSQHRIIQKNTNSNFITCSSLDQFLSSSLPFVPLRPLSVSPPSVEIFESIPAEINEEVTPELDVKAEEEPQLRTQSSISINSFFIPPSINTDIPLPTIIPCTSPIPSTNIWPSVLSIDSPPKRSKTTKQRRNQSNDTTQSYLASNIPPISIRASQPANEIPLDDPHIRDAIQITINSFNDQFQQLLVDLTSQIDSSLRTTRTKYETDLEEIRHSYRLSLNELHSITTEQVQEMHNSLELQYWKRLSEMRHRYESKLHYSLPFN